MGSHSVTCSPTEVKFPPLPQPKLVLDLATPEGCKAELTWVVCWWLLQIPNPLFDLAGITCGHFLVPFGTFFGATLIGKAVVKMHIQVSSLLMVLLYIFKRLIKVMFWRWIFTFLFSNAKRHLAMCKKFQIWRLKQLLDRLSATWLNCTSVSPGWIWFPINESLRYWSDVFASQMTFVTSSHVIAPKELSHPLDPVLFNSPLPGIGTVLCTFVPSVLWHCWRQEEHPACKNWVVGWWCGYLSGAIFCILFAYGPADATATPNPIISCLI